MVSPASLIYQAYLDHPALDDIWPTNSHRQEAHNISAMCRWTNFAWMYPHRGDDNFLFSRNIYFDSIGFNVGPTDLSCTYTWEELTDIKANELLNRSRQEGKRILISWSGGIDSTCIVMALLKWATPQDIQNITLLTKKSAFWESGTTMDYLFKKSVKLTDYDRFIQSATLDYLKDCIFVNGQPADQLLIGTNDTTTNLLRGGRYWATVSWENRGELDRYLSDYILNPQVRSWLINVMSRNIGNHGDVVKSCFNFIWWLNYNYFLSAAFLSEYTQIFKKQCKMPLHLWRSNHFNWFADTRYQHWAYANANNFEVLFGPEVNQWKWVVKKYIYDCTNDPYYFNYKSKQGSGGRNTGLSNGTDPGWMVLTQDQQFLSIDKNIDLVKETISASINPNFVPA
jgi:hypothetical protein